MFFKKESNITKQRKLKEELVKCIDDIAYKLEKGRYSDNLDKEAIASLVANLRKSENKLENSLGSESSDISNGVEKVKADIVEIERNLIGNLDSRVKHSVLDLQMDIEEIMDYEDGIISEISLENTPEDKKEKLLFKKLEELSSYIQIVKKNANNVFNKMERNAADIAELEEKFLATSNVDLQDSLNTQMETIENINVTLSTKKGQYESCVKLLELIESYASELVASASLSMKEETKANIILNIDKITQVFDNPEKLNTLLGYIEKDLKEARKSVEIISKQASKTFNLGSDSDKEARIKARMDKIAAKSAPKTEIKDALSLVHEEMDKMKGTTK